MVSLSKIAEVTGGIVRGKPDFEIKSLQSLELATADAISFCLNPLKDSRFSTFRAGAMILAPQYAEMFNGHSILVADPYLGYAKCSSLFQSVNVHSYSGMHPSAVLSGSATLGEDVSIGAFSSISEGVQIGNRTTIGNNVHVGRNVEIGSDTILENQVVVSEGCKIGSRCKLSPGAVVGSSGFGYAPDGESWHRIEQLGLVVIGDDVDIGANTTIDRGALGNTIIQSGVKIDNLVQIAHNVEIGENTAIAGCVGIAGSAKIGKRCKIAGRAAILGHLEIVDDVTILVNSMVTKSILESGEYGSMIPVQRIQQWKKNVAVMHQLDKLARKVSDFGKK